MPSATGSSGRAGTSCVGLIFKLTQGTLAAMRKIVLAELPGRPCPAAAALELVGERWSLLVVRELSFGKTRFGDIVRGTGAPRDRVAARLKALEEAGVVEREAYQDSPVRWDYRLTEAGARWCR